VLHALSTWTCFTAGWRAGESSTNHSSNPDEKEYQAPKCGGTGLAMTAANGRPTGDTMAVLVCRVHALHCAIPAAWVTEVMRGLATNPFSGMPACMLGLAIIRGVPAPVVDAGTLLSGANSTGAYFVTIDVGGRTIALAVDQLIGLRRIAEDAFEPLPSLLKNGADDAVAAIRARDGELLLLLDAARLVPPHLLSALSEAGTRQ
jgi:purine-binding chemotaxis protein CheW